MKKRLSLMLLAYALLSAGCARHAPPPCAGWERPPKADNPARLVAEEAAIARFLAATRRFGQKQGCWK